MECPGFLYTLERYAGRNEEDTYEDMWHLLLDVTMLGHNGDGAGCVCEVRLQQRMFVHMHWRP